MVREPHDFLAADRFLQLKMPERELFDYYILPLKAPYDFRSKDVLRSIQDRLKNIPKFENTIVEFVLWNTFLWEPQEIQYFESGTPFLESPFIWHGEMQMLKVYFKENDSTILSLDIDCDFLSYHMDIEDIFEDSQALNENQLSHIQEDSYLFWKFSVWSNETQSVYLETLINVLLDFTDGAAAAANSDWEVVLHPTFNFPPSG